ncbi:MAG: sensor domain-containing diguanylate cyclase [Microthrixaceae bacterium]|nr:sensor domain-containing diguanylate cyclase [Microthrixaceae bacterium]
MIISMRPEPEATPRASLVGTAAMGALGIASVILAFAPEAPLLTVLVTAAAVGGSLTVIAHIAFARPLLNLLAQERSGRHHVDAALEQARARRGFIEQLDRAIDMADTEDEALEIVGRAMAMLLPERDNQILLAPPDQPRVTWAIAAGPDGLDEPLALGVAERCSSLSQGRTVTVDSSAELDACPHLAQHGWEVSSMCVPIRIGEQHLGVAHSAGPTGDVPDDEARRLLELVARRVGSRIAGLRAERRPAEYVALDPLTRLPNHTAVQRRLRELLDSNTPFSVALCDVDSFSGYNESHGADSGDAALRLFADVLGATLRPGDLIARFAGDRFLCLFPNCSSVNAASAMERVREALVLEFALLEIDPFTTSVGIADVSDGAGVEELLEVADVALAVAKNQGGNRVVRNHFGESHLTG